MEIKEDHTKIESEKSKKRITKSISGFFLILIVTMCAIIISQPSGSDLFQEIGYYKKDKFRIFTFIITRPTPEIDIKKHAAEQMYSPGVGETVVYYYLPPEKGIDPFIWNLREGVTSHYVLGVLNDSNWSYRYFKFPTGVDTFQKRVKRGG